jgi:hypothetical protein
VHQTNQPNRQQQQQQQRRAMNEYRLARELGNPLSRGLQLYKTTQQWHSLTPALDDDEEAQHHRGGVNALDIDRQQGR